MSAHDFTQQQAETFYSVSELLKDNKVAVTEGKKINLDLRFTPTDDATPDAALRALKMFGYDAVLTSKGEIEITVADIAFSATEIWLHEERTSKIAIERGFVPDGWGFWGD